MLVATLLSSVLLALSSADFYSPRYDEFDIQPLLENDRVLAGYVKCFLEQGPCTPEAKDFRKAIPEALETSCGKCTDKQKSLIRTVIRAVQTKLPEEWAQLVDRYDPEKKHRDSFNKFIEGKE